jgi:hypothetical protein
LYSFSRLSSLVRSMWETQWPEGSRDQRAQGIKLCKAMQVYIEDILRRYIEPRRPCVKAADKDVADQYKPVTLCTKYWNWSGPYIETLLWVQRNMAHFVVSESVDKGAFVSSFVIGMLRDNSALLYRLWIVWKLLVSDV